MTDMSPENAGDVDAQGRREPPLAADEAATLLGFLDFQRETFEWKTRGLSADQLEVSVAASSMTLGGMMKHLAYVEDYWFTEVLGQAEQPAPWNEVDWEADNDWEWHSAAQDSPAELRALWEGSMTRSRATVSSELDLQDGLGRTHPAWGGRGQVSLRWVLVHMIEEYARHNGHADLIREAIDGETGE